MSVGALFDGPAVTLCDGVFPVSVSRCVSEGSGSGRALPRGELVAARGLEDAALSPEGREGVAEGGHAQAAEGAQLAQAERPGGVRERVFDAVEGAGRGPSCRERIGDAVHDGERDGVAGGAEFEGHAAGGRGGAMLDGEEQGVAAAAQVEVRVAPGMELGRTPRPTAARHIPRRLELHDPPRPTLEVILLFRDGHLVLCDINMMTYVRAQIGAESGILTAQGGTWDDATSQPESRRA